MNRFAMAALITITVFNSANATRYNAPPGIPECSEDAHKLCFAVLFDKGKRWRACVRTDLSFLPSALLQSNNADCYALGSILAKLRWLSRRPGANGYAFGQYVHRNE